MSALHIYFSLLLILSSLFAGFVWIATEEMTPSPTDDWELIGTAQTAVSRLQSLSALYLSFSMPIMLFNMFYIITFCTSGGA